MIDTHLRPEWDLNYQKPKMDKWTKVAMIVVVIVSALAIGTVLLIQSLPKTHSISYKDGYTFGRGIITSDSETTGRAATDCSNDWPLGGENGDNPNDWMYGCVAGYNDANYDENHAGANGAPAPNDQWGGDSDLSCNSGYYLVGNQCYEKGSNSGNS